MPDGKRLVLIPSYNPGALLELTVKAALDNWEPVWVVVDGSTDGSEDALIAAESISNYLRVIQLPRNIGKGGAVFAGMSQAQEEGFSHALVMDADGQHPADHIPRFMEESNRNPTAMILGVPQFQQDAPSLRKYGRRVGNWWTKLETLSGGIQDSLFGFRVYPIAETLQVMAETRAGRRYDFDTQVAVRLYWKGIAPINLEAPVKYWTKDAGGVSHFKYIRDNLLLIRSHTLLVFGMLMRIRKLIQLRSRNAAG